MHVAAHEYDTSYNYSAYIASVLNTVLNSECIGDSSVYKANVPITRLATLDEIYRRLINEALCWRTDLAAPQHYDACL